VNRYLFILGRKADLAFAELQTVLHRISKLQPAIIKKFSETVIVETDSTLDGQELMRSLGGTVKIVRLGEPVNSQQFLDYLVNILRNETIGKGKIVFGLSIVGSRDPRQIRLIPRTLKDKLDKEGIPSRYVLPKEGSELTSAQIVLGKVTELYLFSHDHILDIGKTIAAQDFEGFSMRDYGRPYVSPQAGMLPPKVARMMVNLAWEKPPEKDQWLLDPFCGTGTIAMEAMMLGINSLSSDQSPEQVKGTQDNLEWLGKQTHSDASWKVFQAEAVKVSHSLVGPVEAVVTEPYLGPRKPVREKIPNLVKGLDKLYLGALKEWRKILLPGKRVVMVLPEFDVGGLVKKADLIIDRCENVGYTLVAGPLAYERPQAEIKRQIFVLKRKEDIRDGKNQTVRKNNTAQAASRKTPGS